MNTEDIQQRLKIRWPENQWQLERHIGPNDWCPRYKILRDGVEIGRVSLEMIDELHHYYNISLDTLLDSIVNNMDEQSSTSTTSGNTCS